VRIILADDQEKVRSALRLVINQEPDIDVIEEVDNSKALLEAIKKSQPDLLISDWDLIKNDQPSILKRFQNQDANMKVIILSACVLNRQKALAHGAYAFISKVQPVETLLDCLRKIRSDRKLLSSQKSILDT
jgi:two-component system response regulator DesR